MPKTIQNAAQTPRKQCTSVSNTLSGTLEVKGPLSVTWKNVQIPKKSQREVASPKFRFGNALWDLTCGELDGDIWLALYYQCGSKVHLAGSLRGLVLVESGECGLPLPTITGSWNGVLSEGAAFIWRESKNDVERADPGFGQHRQLTFRITIQEEDLESSETGEDNQSVTGAAVQTSPCASPLAESHLKSFTSASVQTSSRINPTSCLENLSEDLEKLLMITNSESDPDVQLHCEGHTTKAHKNILCVRSPVLKSMLQSDMVEGKTGVVNIKDMDSDTFKRFIRYLYTGKLDELTVESAIGLYEAGDMYAVLNLCGRCSRFLVDNLTVENACDVLAVADAHSDVDMVEMVIGFILEKKVPLSDGPWSTFCESHPKLANKVFSRFCKMFCK